MHVLNDVNDPFFTSLQGEVFVSPCPGVACHVPTKPITKPSGANGGSPNAKNPKIAIAVVVSVVGAMILILATWYFCRLQSRKKEVLLKS
jgi:endoglucanase